MGQNSSYIFRKRDVSAVKRL